MGQTGLRVLIVDEDEKVRNALARLLRRNGMEPATSTSGERAFSRIKHGEHFDCVIVDLLLPDMRGSDFIQALAEEAAYPLKRIIILTAIHNVDNATAYMQYGIAGYCGKPFDNDRILEQVRRASGEITEGGELNALV